MSSFANISIRFSADLKQFSTQLDNAKRQLKSTGEQFKKVGAGLTVGLTAPLIALGAKSFSVFADFEDQLAKVKAISGATTQQFDALRKNAEALGASTRFTASEVAELQLNLSKLGFNPDEINATTAGVLDLALATGEDLANSAAVAAGTLRAFGLGVGETQRVVDVMAKSFGSSALDLERFKTAMGVVGPVAKTAGVELEKATAQLGILINSNVDASTAGTSLRNIYLTLAETGLTYNQALDKIATSTNKNATALQLFGKRGATAAVILADNKDEVNALGIELDNAAGAAAAMALIMDNTAKGSLARMKSAIESVFIVIGERLAPVIRTVADFIAQLASGFRNMSPEVQKIVVVVGAFAAALGPLLLGLGVLSTTVLPALLTGFALLVSPIGLVVAGLTAIAVVIATNWDSVTRVVQNVVQYFKDLYDNVAIVRTVVDQVRSDFLILGAVVKSVFGDVVRVIGIALQEVGNQITIYSKVLESFLNGDILDGAIGIKVATKSMTAAFKDAFAAIKEDNSQTVDDIIAKVKEIAKAYSSTTVTPTPTSGGTGAAQPQLSGDAVSSLTTEGVKELSGALDELAPKLALPVPDEAFMRYLQRLEQLKETAQIVGRSVGDAFGLMTSNFLSSLELADTGLNRFVTTLANGVTQIIAQLLSAAVAQAILGGSSAGASTGAAAPVTTPVFIAELIGVVFGAFASIPKFADGGIVSGPTLGLMGEYAGARNNPEVIAPLNKLKDLIGGSTGDVVLNGGFQVSGDQLRLVLDRSDSKNSRRG